jgi:hypothetical protein
MPNTTSELMTPQQLFAMTDAQRTAYYASLPADQASQEKQSFTDYVRQLSEANTRYLQASQDMNVICPPSSGGTSATYAASTTLDFNLPQVNAAYIRELIVVGDIKFTPATGSSATYGWTPAGAAAWFTEIRLDYNGNQIRLHPYFPMKILPVLQRPQALAMNQVLSGLTADATQTAIIGQPEPSLTGGSAATSKFYFHIPLQLTRWSPIGMLPSQGQGTQGQLHFVTATTLGAANPDPLNTPINYTGGSGNSITLDSTEKTVTVYAVLNDGTSTLSKSPLALHLEGLPTLQYAIDQPLMNLTGSVVNSQRIFTLQKHVVAASVIIDGNQSTSFAATSNIQSIMLSKDAAMQNLFWQYGSANNTSYSLYADQFRHDHGQDLAPGVVIWADALHRNTIDLSNCNGMQFLNMAEGAWTNTYYGVQVGSVTSTYITPRVVTWLWTMNDAGLVLG